MRKYQRGLTVIELLIAFAVIAAVVASILWMYQTRIAPRLQARDLLTAFDSVVAALENAKAANRNVYPAVDSPTNILSINELAPFVGTASEDIALWTYQCPRSTTAPSTMTIQIPVQGYNQDAINEVLLNINNRPNWSATLSGDTIVAQRTGVICR